MLLELAKKNAKATVVLPKQAFSDVGWHDTLVVRRDGAFPRRETDVGDASLSIYRLSTKTLTSPGPIPEDCFEQIVSAAVQGGRVIGKRRVLDGRATF